MPISRREKVPFQHHYQIVLPFIITGWHGRVVKLKPKTPSRCRLQVQLYSPTKDCIRTRNGLKNYCADHDLDIRNFDTIKFFHNPSYMAADDNANEASTINDCDISDDKERVPLQADAIDVPATKKDIIEEKNNNENIVMFFGYWDRVYEAIPEPLEDTTKPAKLKMDDIYTNAIENSTKTFAKEDPKRWYPRFSNLGEIDENCQIGRKYLTPREPGPAVTQTTFSCNKPVVCDKINSETLTKKNEVIINIFPRTQGLDTIYGFIEARLTGQFEYKPAVLISDDSRFRGETPFENFRYHV